MPYLILRQDILPDAMSVRPTDALDLIELRKGTLLKNTQEPVQLELGEQDQTESDFLESPYFIVSNKMREALLAFGIDNIQYFKAILVEPVTGREFPEYWLGNVVGVVKCVDESRSTFKKLSGTRTILRGFVVEESATTSLNIFRLDESRRLVLISDALKQHLEQSGLKGLYFQKTLDFNGKPASSFW